MVQKLNSGDQLGRYELVREVAKGFPGPLWLVNFEHQGQRVLALGRVVPREEPMTEATWSALTESAWDAMDVSHACVLPAADVVFESARLMTVYDYAEGEPLSVLERLKTVQHTLLPPAIALRIGIDLLDALDALHVAALELGARGAFGGVGSDSLLVGTDGRTRLLDVFVAGSASEQDELRMHQDRVRYVAPEQFSRELVDCRADVYAAGCVLWELLANRRMHIGAPAAVERRVKLGQLPELRPAEPVPHAVVEIVQTALRPDRRQRFETAAAMSKALVDSGAEVADHGAVGEFVRRLASRQLESRRKATEHSTIAKLRDLLESRPPARAVRRSLAPAAESSVSERGHAPTSEAPTAAMPQAVLNQMVSAVEQATPAAAPSPPRHKAFQGTLMGMPVPAEAAQFAGELSAPLPPPVAKSEPALSSVRVVPQRTVAVLPIPQGDSAHLPHVPTTDLASEPTFPADPGVPRDFSPSVEPRGLNAEPALAAATSPAVARHTGSLTPSPDLRHQNLLRLTWSLVGSSVTLAVLLVVMLLRERKDVGEADAVTLSGSPGAASTSEAPAVTSTPSGSATAAPALEVAPATSTGSAPAVLAPAPAACVELPPPSTPSVPTSSAPPALRPLPPAVGRSLPPAVGPSLPPATARPLPSAAAQRPKPPPKPTKKFVPDEL